MVSKSIQIVAASVIGVILSVFCGCSGSVSPTAGQSSKQQIVDVAGNSMTLNDVPWLSRGVTLRGFVAPAAFLQANYPNAAYLGTKNYGTAELNAASAFGADTLRFQVSQPSLDTEDPKYDEAYVASLVAAITLARKNGFVVMIMMQDEPFSGELHRHPLAIQQTVRDWDYLNSQFGTDRGVLFELYNEPQVPDKLAIPTSADWALWANGGLTSAGAEPSIGMQTMINRLRREGCLNVFILDGLNGAQTLEGLPSMTDTLNRLVYAVHPYPHGSSDESQWDPEFGNKSASIPVYADEWSAPAGTALGLGSLPAYGVALDLLNYLQRHQISLGGAAFDAPDEMVQDVPGWTPTNYDNFDPTDFHLDAGLLVNKLFLTNYKQRLTLADGVTH